MEGKKRCSHCREIKSLGDFYKNRTKPDGYQRACKICTRIQNRAAYQKRGPKKDYQLKGRISQKEYETLLIKQDYLCAICKRAENHAGRKRLSLDHNHKTGKTRGLICHRCNEGLGYFQDDPILLKNAADYLEANA